MGTYVRDIDVAKSAKLNTHILATCTIGKYDTTFSWLRDEVTLIKYIISGMQIQGLTKRVDNFYSLHL